MKASLAAKFETRQLINTPQKWYQQQFDVQYSQVAWTDETQPTDQKRWTKGLEVSIISII